MLYRVHMPSGNRLVPEGSSDMCWSCGHKIKCQYYRMLTQLKNRNYAVVNCPDIELDFIPDESIYKGWTKYERY